MDTAIYGALAAGAEEIAGCDLASAALPSLVQVINSYIEVSSEAVRI